MRKSYSKTLLTLLLGAAACIAEVKAQDPHFTQFFAAPVYTNPAFAGTSNYCGPRFVVNYRNQWPNLPGTFVTTAASYDQEVDAIGGGVGVIALRDQAGQGLLTTHQVSLVYAYTLRVNDEFTMKLAAQAGIIQKSIDWSKLTFSDMIEPRSGFQYPTGEVFPPDNKIFPNFSAGILGYSKNFYFGFASHNLTEPNQSFYNNPDRASRLPRRYTAHAGMVIKLSKRRNSDATFSPNILYMNQNKFTQVNFGFYINKGPLVAGMWWRQTQPNSDAVLALLGFRTGQFKFGYSYDITVSGAKSAVRGSHEISAALELKCKVRPRKPRPIPCPDF